jgi:Peptidase family C25
VKPRHPAPVALVGACLALASSASPAPPTSTPSALHRQWAISAGRAAKIEVRRDSWYRLSRSSLRAAGIDLSSPAGLRLYADGNQVPVRISRGSLEFYGLARDTPSTDTRTYWLIRGPSSGLRIPVVAEPAEHELVFARSFPFTLERKYRTIYSTLQNGERQNYFGSMIYAKPMTLDVATRDLAQPTGSLELVVQGLSKRSHRIAVALNGRQLGQVAFGGQANVSKRFRLERGLVREGTNRMTLTAVGGDADVSFIDTVRLTYPRGYRAERNQLRFSLAPDRAARVTGFSRPNVTVVDITNPSSPRLLRPTMRHARGGFTAVIAPAPHARRLLASTTAPRPAAVVRNRPSSWHETRGADLVIVTHRSFLPQLARLKAYHERQGLKVALVDVEDLYDEFGFGTHGPLAIRAFLARAWSQWRPAPRYVVLAGDATSDPRGYLGYPSRDFVPTKTVDTQYMETASDDWFADFDGDGIPEMAVGRLPVRTAAEAALVVDKIIGYEQAPRTAGREALLVSDNGFESATEALRALLPATTTATIKRSDGPTDRDVRGRILDALNRGPSVVNYYGHGTVALWTGASLLRSADARALANSDGMSLFVMMTCLNGYFIEPKTQSLAEALLRAPHGGAFAVWASSGLTEVSDQIRANEELFRQLDSAEPPRLGDAMVRAKAVVGDPDVRRTWILFGDPLARLRWRA